MTTVDEIMQLCRLCLVKDQVNVSIFDEETEMQKIFTKINTLLPVKVAKNDNLPKKICDDCSFKLDMLYIFRKKSAESEKQLNVWLASGSKDPKPEVLVKQETFESAESRTDDEHVGAAAYLMQQELEELDESALEEEPARKRIKRTPKSAAETDEDEFDDSMITKAEDDDSDDLDQGDYAEDPSLGTDDEQPGPSGVAKGTTETPPESLLEKLIYGPSISITPIAGRVRSARKKKKAKNAKESDTKKNGTDAVHCEVCDVTYENSVAFAIHSIDHNTDNKYSCHFCDYRNASKYHIEMHIKAHEGNTKYKCEICQKAFTVSTHAIEHKYFHTGEKPFQCEICGKHFMFSWFLTSHRRTQHWEIMTGTPLVKYDCTICNKHYTSSTGLRRHNLSKHNVNGVDSSVLCDICGKRLSSKEKLKFHRRIHTGYKPFACEICTKSFSRKEQLKEHERVHTGEKPFICNYCGKGFTQRSPLRIHERTHTGERPYICRLCGKGFISKGVMDTHMKSCPGMPIY